MNSPTALRGTKSTFFALIVSLQPLAQIRIAEGEEVRQTSLEVLLAFRVAVASRGGAGMVTPSEARGAPGAPVRMRDGVGLEAGHAVVATDLPDDPGVARKPMTDQEVEEALPPQPSGPSPGGGGISTQGATGGTVAGPFSCGDIRRHPQV